MLSTDKIVNANRGQTRLFFCSLFVIYFCAWFMQSYFVLNWDVSWLMRVTRLMLAGGVYGKDFFEINPPMILYLYIPPVLLNTILPISIIVALRLYVFVIASISFFFCYQLIQKIILAQDVFIKSSLLISLAAIFLIVPVYDFGQREHLMLMLVMPYLFLIASRVEQKQVNLSLAILIGLMAGFGFAIKPYFYAVFFIFELYLLVKQKKLLAWLRPETGMILFVTFAYILCLLFVQREYLTVILPQVTMVYYQGFGYPLLMLVFNPLLFYGYTAATFYWFQIHKNPYPVLCHVMLLGLAGFLVVYLLQHTLWSYHVLPLYSLAILLYVLLFSGLVKNQLKAVNFRHAQYIGLSLYAALIFSFPIYVLFWYSSYVLPRKHELLPLIDFLNAHAKHQPVYFFATTTGFEFPALDYTESEHASQVAFMGWLAALVKHDNPQQKQYFFNMVITELNANKPKYVFVDVKNDKENLVGISFDFLNYFLQNKAFIQAWKNYHYVTRIESLPLMQLDVYQRIGT